MKTKEATPRVVIKGRCQGADLRRWFAILLRHHGNVSIAEVK